MRDVDLKRGGDDEVILLGLGSGKSINFIRGKKFFELSNHLGNVLATVSDKKLGVLEGGSLVYGADVVSANEYYPFGMLMPGRGWNTGRYRYGFNGQEKSDEVKGEGNQQDYGMRVYDPRIGKFLSIDPLFESYPYYSPYLFAGNTPIWVIDVDGKGPGPGPGSSSLPIPGSYLNFLNNIDMTGTPKVVTSLNGNDSVATTYTKPLNTPRNYLQYWNSLMIQRPEAFSPANVAKISNGAAPHVDQTWIEANPPHVGFEKAKLIHHHIDQAEIATALPEPVHNAYTKELHPLKYPKAVSGGLSLSLNIFSIAIEAFSNNPHTIWNSTFGNGINLGQLYENPGGGYYKIININKQYEKGKLVKESRTVDLYRDMGKDKDGNYIGVDKYDQRVIETDYKNNKTKVLGPAA
jgi:RHS repeat-associated protein